MSSYKSLVESELSAAILKLNGPQKLKDAMKYSLEAGGKRIRPLLLFLPLMPSVKSLNPVFRLPVH